MKMAINFNSNTWTCGDALVDIFFSDWKEVREDETYRKVVKDCVLFYVASNKQDQDSGILQEEEEDRVASVITQLKKLSPAPSSRLIASPLVWTRFAFTALRHEIAPADYFLSRYARWRFGRMLNIGLETVLKMQPENRDIPQRELNLDGQKFSGYTIDEFMFNQNTHADLGSKTQWVLVTAQAVARGRQQRKNAILQNGTKPKRTNEEIVGAHAYKRIADCIKVAVKDRLIDGLHRKKIDGRYECSITRSVLAERLFGKFPNIGCSEATIVKALSDFVACPGSRNR